MPSMKIKTYPGRQQKGEWTCPECGFTQIGNIANKIRTTNELKCHNCSVCISINNVTKQSVEYDIEYIIEDKEHIVDVTHVTVSNCPFCEKDYHVHPSTRLGDTLRCSYCGTTYILIKKVDGDEEGCLTLRFLARRC